MTRKSEMVSDAAIYTTLSVVTQLLTLVTGILTRHYLGPVQMGVWSLLQIILVYSSYSTFGVTEAISREIPFYLAKGDEEKAKQMKDGIVSFSLVTAWIIFIGLIAYSFLFKNNLRSEIYFGLLLMALLVVLQRVSNLHIAFLRAYKYFDFAGKFMVISALANSVFVMVLTYRFAMYGFMWAMVISFIFNIIVIRMRHPFSFDWRLKADEIWHMIQYGFPLMIVGFLGAFFLSIDKMMIAKFLGLRELGIYSLAIMAYTYVSNIPNSIGIVLIPNFHEKFGKDERPEALRGYLEKSTQTFSDLMPLLIAGVWCFGACFARKILPDFKESIPPMKTLLLSAYFLSLMHPFQYFLAVIRKQKLIIPVIAIACVLAFGVNYAVLKSGLGLNGVSLATTFVLWMKFTGVYFLAAPNVFKPGETVKNYFYYVAKFTYFSAALLLADRLWPGAEESLWKVSVQFGMFAVLFMPFLIKLNRDLNLIATLRKKFSRVDPVQEESLESSAS